MTANDVAWRSSSVGIQVGDIALSVCYALVAVHLAVNINRSKVFLIFFLRLAKIIHTENQHFINKNTIM